MFKPKLLLRVAGLVRAGIIDRHDAKTGRFIGRFNFADASNQAFQFRMLAGFPGVVSRMHPAPMIEPVLNDPTNPVLGYGFATILDATSHNARQMASGDTAVTKLYGVAVRPFPVSQTQASSDFAPQTMGATPGVPPLGEIDILRKGYILVPIQGTPVKGGAVYVWVAANSGAHLQGGFEASRTSGSCASLDTETTFQGGVDANGIGEIAFNI